MLHDLRHAARGLLRAPGFTLSAVFALALGIGANTAVFSVIYAVLLKPLPYREPDRLVRLYEANPAEGVERGEVSAGTFMDWRSRSRTIEHASMFVIPLGGETLWTVGDQVVVVKATSVSPTLFAALGVQPILGRTFSSDADLQQGGGVGQFLISYGLWQRAFGGAADIVGRRILIEGRLPREVIGVMPPGFGFPEGTEAWVARPFRDIPVKARRMQSGQVLARLAPGASIEDARRELRGISAQLAVEQPSSNRGWTADVEPLAGADARQARFALLALMSAVAGVLLIGCANLANLLLARGMARRRDVGVRIALGAGTLDLLRLAVAEALLLAGGGIAAGLLVAAWLSGTLVRLAPADVPRLDAVGLSGAVLLFAIACGAAAAVAAAVLPALHTLRTARRGSLRADSRAATEQGQALRRWLIAGEVAVVVLLVTGAFLLIRTFVKLRGVDLGFESQQVAEVETRWPIGTLFGRPGQQWPRVQRAVDGLLDAVGRMPGVEAVGTITEAPLTGNATEATLWRKDAAGASEQTPPVDAGARWKADVAITSPGYFPALRIPVLRGRNFTGDDRFTDQQLVADASGRTGVAIVNATFAARYFRNDDPVGRTLIIPDAGTFAAARTIVGVVADVRGHSVAEPAKPTVYIPLAQNPDLIRPSLLVRSSLPFDALARDLRARLAEYDRQLLVLRIRPMDDVVSGALARPRFNLLLLAAFAVIALGLAAIGIYGVLAYLVTERTREIGIRVALGAQRGQVLRLLMREGMAPVLAGTLAGVIASLASARAIRSLLFGVTPLDPVSVAGAPLLLAAVALVACYLPARRALRVDPIVALRDE